MRFLCFAICMYFYALSMWVCLYVSGCAHVCVEARNQTWVPFFKSFPFLQFILLFKLCTCVSGKGECMHVSTDSHRGQRSPTKVRVPWVRVTGDCEQPDTSAKSSFQSFIFFPETGSLIGLDPNNCVRLAAEKVPAILCLPFPGLGLQEYSTMPIHYVGLKYQVFMLAWRVLDPWNNIPNPIHHLSKREN